MSRVKKQVNLFSWRQAVVTSDLSSTTKHVLLTLACHMNDMGESCFPSVDTLSVETSLSRRTVITHIQKAKQEYWLNVGLHGFGGQKWRSHEYTVSIPQKVVKESNHVFEEGGEPVAEGGEPDDQKVVKEVHSNSSYNSSYNSSVSLGTSADTDDTQEDRKSKRQSRYEYTEAFESAWAGYPKRDGPNNKRAAFKAWQARLAQGVGSEEMQDGVQRYAAYLEARGKAGTSFVMHGSTFFGPNERYADEYPIESADIASDGGEKPWDGAR